MPSEFCVAQNIRLVYSELKGRTNVLPGLSLEAELGLICLTLMSKPEISENFVKRLLLIMREMAFLVYKLIGSVLVIICYHILILYD